MRYGDVFSSRPLVQIPGQIQLKTYDKYTEMEMST